MTATVLRFPGDFRIGIRPHHDAMMVALHESIINLDRHFDLVATAAGSGHEIPPQCLAAMKFNALRIAGLTDYLLKQNADSRGVAPCAAAISREGQP